MVVLFSFLSILGNFGFSQEMSSVPRNINDCIDYLYRDEQILISNDAEMYTELDMRHLNLGISRFYMKRLNSNVILSFEARNGIVRSASIKVEYYEKVKYDNVIKDIPTIMLAYHGYKKSESNILNVKSIVYEANIENQIKLTISYGYYTYIDEETNETKWLGNVTISTYGPDIGNK
jgi:hypothetical protein